MLSGLRKYHRGFTIIEVMIVLAIAGVMMSIIFLAVPQLQRNSRDSQREAIVEAIRSEIETYAANNTGKYPLSTVGSTDCNPAPSSGTFADFYCNYIYNGTIHYKNDIDPSSGSTIFVSGANSGSKFTPSQCSTAASMQAGDSCTPYTAATGQATMFLHAKCNGSTAQSVDGVTTGTTTRSYALVIGLERSGTSFCVDNS